MFFKFLNRPISPHLTIYLPQFSSLFSIWHRLSAILLISYNLVIIYIPKLYYWKPTLNLVYIITIINIVWISAVIKSLIWLILFYHMLSGLKHISWDLGYIFEHRNFQKSFIILSIVLFCLQIISIKRL